MKMLSKILMISSLTLITSLQAQVDISSESLQLVKVDKEMVWVKATTVIPGTVIRFKNTIKNNGKEEATNLVVLNNISKFMELVPNSAKCGGGCKITYAVDLNEGYKAPSDLYIVDPKTKLRRLAKEKEYVSIKWVLDSLDAEKTTSVQYESKIK